MWANVEAWHLALWLTTLVELWAWPPAREDLVDRSASPWDVAHRRPSHADRCKALRRPVLKAELKGGEAGPTDCGVIGQLWQRLLSLVT